MGRKSEAEKILDYADKYYEQKLRLARINEKMNSTFGAYERQLKAENYKLKEDEPAQKARWEALCKWGEESERLIRENTVLALLFADGKGWPMQVCLWVIYTSKTHYLNPDSSPGIPVEKAIKMFFDEFKTELEITRPKAKHNSLKQAIKRLKAEDWRG